MENLHVPYDSHSDKMCGRRLRINYSAGPRGATADCGMKGSLAPTPIPRVALLTEVSVLVPGSFLSHHLQQAGLLSLRTDTEFRCDR